MKVLERLSDGIGSGRIRGIYEDADARDGRRFCVWCRKLIRPGQEVIEDWGPDQRYRRTRRSFQHVSCPSVYRSRWRKEKHA